MDDQAQSTIRSSYSIHFTAEDLAYRLPHELLLLAITGILYTPDRDLAVRAVAIGLLYTQAQRISKGEISDGSWPVAYDTKTVSQHLGLRPAEVRRAYEKLAELGGVHILARWFPRKPRQQLPLPLDSGTPDGEKSILGRAESSWL